MALERACFNGFGRRRHPKVLKRHLLRARTVVLDLRNKVISTSAVTWNKSFNSFSEPR